jgi:hypothetical protein
MVHCLVVGGAWWQQALAQHPLLLLQVLMTVADVSIGHQGRECSCAHMTLMQLCVSAAFTPPT